MASQAADPSQQELFALFAKLEDSFTHTTTLGSSRWYIVTAATLAGSNDPTLCAQLYLYLIAQPQFSQPSQRHQLIRRLRETLVKCVSIIGVCKPLEAIIAIHEHERDEDKDPSPPTRASWQCDEAHRERGQAWFSQLYARNSGDQASLFRDHADFRWITENITYGLYLSDRTVLDDIETEMVVLPGIMIQNLPKETHWHIRGTRRIGVPLEEVRIVWDAVQMIAGHLGMRLHRVPTVDEVEPDV